jgi:2-dehydro-3-deoxyglucarate aldolase/4-hydroxy-2-oxoheptanedioate aldolase
MFDPDRPTLKARILAGDCLAVSWLSLGSVAVAETAARGAPDAIVLDLQHGLWDRRELEAAIGAVPASVPVIVRVAENSALAIGTALDAGAEGVMVPMIESGAAAEQAVRYAKYPPQGVRSAGGVRPLKDFGAYVRGASELAVMVMIETAAGLAHAREIAAAAGVDMVFIGTGDLALSLQTAGADARHAEACDQIHAACRAASRACGIFTGTREAALKGRTQGYGMVVAASDIDIVSRGFADATAAFRTGKAPA